MTLQNGSVNCDALEYKEDLIMAYVITDDCVMCGTCVAECPTEAIVDA